MVYSKFFIMQTVYKGTELFKSGHADVRTALEIATNISRCWEIGRSESHYPHQQRTDDVKNRITTIHQSRLSLPLMLFGSTKILRVGCPFITQKSMGTATETSALATWSDIIISAITCWIGASLVWHLDLRNNRTCTWSAHHLHQLKKATESDSCLVECLW